MLDNNNHHKYGFDCTPIQPIVAYNSLASDDSCSNWTGSNNHSSVDPLVSALGNHSGPTETYLPDANSPAVDAGFLCAPTDQRGIPRPQGPACDIGAVERPAFEPIAWLFLPLIKR